MLGLLLALTCNANPLAQRDLREERAALHAADSAFAVRASQGLLPASATCSTRTWSSSTQGSECSSARLPRSRCSPRTASRRARRRSGGRAGRCLGRRRRRIHLRVRQRDGSVWVGGCGPHAAREVHRLLAEESDGRLEGSSVCARVSARHGAGRPTAGLRVPLVHSVSAASRIRIRPVRGRAVMDADRAFAARAVTDDSHRVRCLRGDRRGDPLGAPGSSMDPLRSAATSRPTSGDGADSLAARGGRRRRRRRTWAHRRRGRDPHCGAGRSVAHELHQVSHRLEAHRCRRVALRHRRRDDRPHREGMQLIAVSAGLAFWGALCTSFSCRAHSNTLVCS